jgi:hypothetical protein
MVQLNVNEVSYKIPERLTLTQWKEVSKWSFEEPTDWPRIIAAVTGADWRQLELGKDDAVALAVAFIIQLMNHRSEYQIKDFNELTFGQFVDLDVWLTMGIDKHIDDVVNMLSDGTDHADEAMWLVDRYAEFRLHTYRQYKSLFGLNDNFEMIEGDPDFDPLKIAKGWYKIIVSLANDNLLDIDKVTDEPLKKVLNFMALQKEKQIEANIEIMKQNRKLRQ